MPETAGSLGFGAPVASTIGGVADFGTGVIMIRLIAWTMGVKARALIGVATRAVDRTPEIAVEEEPPWTSSRE